VHRDRDDFHGIVSLLVCRNELRLLSRSLFVPERNFYFRQESRRKLEGGKWRANDTLHEKITVCAIAAQNNVHHHGIRRRRMQPA
jgi:hypothetical protein